MKNALKATLYATTVSIALLGAIGAPALFLSADSAIAKSNNGNNGQGNGNNGNRGNSGNTGNNENSGNNGNNSSNSNANAASWLGALNAGHANANAQENAASNSRVGLIQAYEAAVIATSVAQQEYEAALAALGEFAGFESQFESLEVFTAAFEADPAGLEEEAAYWAAFAALSTSNSNLHFSREIEGMALQQAANKETNEETITRLWDLLGVPSTE